MASPAFPDAAGVTHHRNLAFARIQGFRPLHLDLHVPPGEGRKPLIAYLHGGAFWEGSRVDLPPPLAEMEAPGFYERAFARGYAVADIDYRLSGEAPFPAQLEDVQAAFAFLHANAAGLGLDPVRFGAWGESAGGTLAALAGLAPGSPIAAVATWYTPMDLGAHVDDIPGGPAEVLLQPARDGFEERARAASPVCRVRADAPPFLVVQGTDDQIVPLAEAEAFVKALEAVGAPHRFVVVPGGDHCFTTGPAMSGHVETLLDFFDSVLA